MGSELRVISGKYRGRKLSSPDLAGTHPMGSREKLALFNMVNMEGAKVLDAFAGSGALGIEALSRGANEVAFVESSAKVARTIGENLETLDIGYGVLKVDGGVAMKSNLPATILVGKVEKLAKESGGWKGFDVILADPPYDKFQLGMISGLGKLLKKDGVLVVSSPVEFGEIELPGLRKSSSHTYARARVTVYWKR